MSLKRVSIIVLLITLSLKETSTKNTANLDLNDEKDDGTALVLKDSEIIIVPPEEDEDQTDDQATDSDKPEDLEDLKHLGTIYVNRNSTDYYYDLGEFSDFQFLVNPVKNESFYISKEYFHEGNSDTKSGPETVKSDYALKTFSHKNKSLSKLRSPKAGKGSGHEEEYSDYYDEKSRLTELNNNRDTKLIETVIESTDKDWMHHYTRGLPENKWQKRNQILLVVIVFLSALIILSASVSIVLLVKLKLNHRRQHRRRLDDKLMDFDEESES